MRRFAVLLALVPTAAVAQHQHMPGMTMPRAPAPAPTPTPAADPACSPEHAAMGHCTSAAPSVPAMPSASGTALPAGDAPAPTPPAPDYADRYWGAPAMDQSRDALRREHGGGTFSQLMIDLAELQVRDGRDGYRWEGEGWFGGDVDRLVVKSEGAGSFGERIDDAEVQALYSRAIGPYFNLQAGVRQDIRPTPARTYAAIGVDGLAPYWFELEAHAFVSTRGDVLGRVTASYDQRLTQRLILQPRVELNLAAQDVAATRTGAGLSDAELGLRLRYEIKREFAPYIGVSWDRKLGATARFARDDGEDRGGVSVVAGVRVWF